MLTFLRKLSLTHWILISMLLGTLVGWAFPDEQWSGQVKAVSPDLAEVVVVSPEGKEVTLRREGKPAAGAWEGRDVGRDIPVKLTVEGPGPRRDPKEGDTVKVE